MTLEKTQGNGGSMDGTLIYEIVLKGKICQHNEEYFYPFNCRVDGEKTILSGEVRDGAELHGVLVKIRNLNLHLISLREMD
jgi:hypothetical protein